MTAASPKKDGPRAARPITDARLAVLRREANTFDRCLSSDVRALITRFDATDAELRALRRLPQTPGPAKTGPASAAASSRADGS